MPAPTLLVYSRESAIAEKFEAIVALGATNSRFKDYFDILTLSRRFAFAGQVTATAIGETFLRRGRRIPDGLPIGLTTEWAGARGQEANWRAFLRRSAIRAPTESFADVVDEIVAFLVPPARAVANGSRFNDEWLPGSGWVARI